MKKKQKYTLKNYKPTLDTKREKIQTVHSKRIHTINLMNLTQSILNSKQTSSKKRRHTLSYIERLKDQKGKFSARSHRTQKIFYKVKKGQELNSCRNESISPYLIFAQIAKEKEKESEAKVGWRIVKKKSSPFKKLESPRISQKPSPKIKINSENSGWLFNDRGSKLQAWKVTDQENFYIPS